MNIPAGFEIESQTDDRIVLVKKAGKDWVPGECEKFYYVDHVGTVMRASFHRDLFLHFGNCFPTREMAPKSAKLMGRPNHIIRACLLVDPEFEPDWDSEIRKYFPYFNRKFGQWAACHNNRFNGATAYVSTEEKCKEVCALLTKWGIE